MNYFAMLCASAALTATLSSFAGTPASGMTPKDVYGTGNPYLPLWEHLPDGEPRVFEDPDNPGKFRAYIIGSHDTSFDKYCGSDIRMWSAPVEDLTDWRDEGPIFTYSVDDNWDIMYAPDLVEIPQKDGSKIYYLYPHSRGPRREAMVCKGNRPDGPFTPVNLWQPSLTRTPCTPHVREQKSYLTSFRPAPPRELSATRKELHIRLSTRTRTRPTSTSSKHPRSARWAINM